MSKFEGEVTVILPNRPGFVVTKSDGVLTRSKHDVTPADRDAARALLRELLSRLDDMPDEPAAPTSIEAPVDIEPTAEEHAAETFTPAASDAAAKVPAPSAGTEIARVSRHEKHKTGKKHKTGSHR